MNKQDAAAQFYDGRLGELYQAIAGSKVVQHRRFLLIGNNPSVDTATVPEDVWPNGGVYPIITAPVLLEVVSSSAADTAAGTGARSVAVFCLDANYNEVTYVITMAGLTPVVLPASVIAVNLSVVFSAGSGETNAGDITIRDSGGGTARDIIPASVGQTRKGVYTIPAGYYLNLNKAIATINRNAGPATTFATIGLGVRSVAGVRRIPIEYGISTNVPGEINFNPGAIIQEKETIFVRCLSASANAMNVTVAAGGILSKL